ncbi:protein TolQ [Leeia sp. TBRC 13508]|uniref:Tol-Pal system protein TolQ n=1 Tax=Leeia speluncae TaxID=2884804 RepID=A0ABS8D6P6_9NEIS|nr:protein TolQ [Leeia speluncae]MCB6183871.1 protein TolQ [Leeia speluncae]
MEASTDLSFMHLITGASVIVQLVMIALLFMSLMSWSFIFSKWSAIRKASKQSAQFERQFWSGNDLNQLYQHASQNSEDNIGMSRIFTAGFGEFLKQKRQTGVEPRDMMDSVQRAMRAEYQREIDRLESHLAFLATTGSVSPYIGLFGTVWGIMNAFRGLANVGQATLAHVAPGIAEALIATAIGLFAAIPAVVAYNRYLHDIDRLSIKLESFMEEFSNILQRQAGR